MLEVDVERRLGDFHLAATFRSEGGLTVLFGRSGAGKSSIINMIGGLLRPDRGRIAIDGRVLFDSDARINLLPAKRRIGYVFQEGRLFPHMSVRQNLLYGQWFTPHGERYARFDALVEMLGIGELLQRRPATLSGGEKQRVAIGRALLSSPRLLLMDEPLASLDSKRKEEILPYIERLRDEIGVPVVYVSHALSEVVRLATTMVLLADGTVVAAGPIGEVMARTDLFPAGSSFEGGAVLSAEVVSHDKDFALTTLRTAAGTIYVPQVDLPAGRSVRVHVHARDVMLSLRPPEGFSALNTLPGTITEIGPPEGAGVQVRLDCHGDVLLARLTRRSLDGLGLAVGRPVYAVIKSVALDRRDLGSSSPAAAARLEHHDM